MKLFTPKSHFSVPTTTTAFPCLVWSAWVVFTAAAIQDIWYVVNTMRITSNSQQYSKVMQVMPNIAKCYKNILTNVHKFIYI